MELQLTKRRVNVTKVGSVGWQEVKADAGLTVSLHSGPAVAI